MMIKRAFTLPDLIAKQAMQIIPVSRGGPDFRWFEKQGSLLTEKRAHLKPVAGHTPILAIAMGAMETTGSNRNADYWPGWAGRKRIYQPAFGKSASLQIRAGLKERHPTFVSHGRVFRGHRNKDPKKASGFIHSSDFNEDDGRVELIAYVDNEKWASALDRMAKGEPSPVSMAAKIKSDVCILCGNEAPSPKTYCTHMQRYKNAMMGGDLAGLQIGVINRQPTFIDLSDVDRNADRLGVGLGTLETEQPAEKAASLSVGEDTGRRQLAGKLAEMEKRLVGHLQGCGQGKLRVSDPRMPRNIPNQTILVLRTHSLPTTARALSDEQIVLPPEEFFRLGCGDSFQKVAPHLDAMRRLLPKVFQNLAGKDLSTPAEPGTYVIKLPGLEHELQTMAPQLSLKEAPVDARVTFSVQRFSSPPGETKIEVRSEKEAQSDDVARGLADEYGRYLLSYLAQPGREKDAELVVATNVAESQRNFP